MACIVYPMVFNTVTVLGGVVILAFLMGLLVNMEKNTPFKFLLATLGVIGFAAGIGGFLYLVAGGTI